MVLKFDEMCLEMVCYDSLVAQTKLLVISPNAGCHIIATTKKAATMFSFLLCVLLDMPNRLLSIGIAIQYSM